jgi:hypothetical protein
MKNSRSFYLVKIMDNVWINKFLNGEIYMRALSDFGSWDLENKLKSHDLNNYFRGDAWEGICETLDLSKPDDFFRLLPDDLVNAISAFGYVGDDYKYERILCLYCLKYNPTNNLFEKPDERMAEFGDTAAIILNPCEFLRRIIYALERKFKKAFWLAFKAVSYNDILRIPGSYNEFCKSNSYSWQNEYRLAVDTESFHNDTNPFILRIGSIRDICTSVSTKDLMDLNFPYNLISNAFFPPQTFDDLDIPRKQIQAMRPIMIVGG